MKGALRMTISDTGDGVLFEVVCKVCGQTISRDTLRVGAGDDALVAAAGADAAAAREHLRRCPGAAAGVPAGRPVARQRRFAARELARLQERVGELAWSNRSGAITTPSRRRPCSRLHALPPPVTDLPLLMVAGGGFEPPTFGL